MKIKYFIKRPSSTLTAIALSVFVFLNSLTPLLAQEVNGGADLTRDISGGAAGVLKIPRASKPHKTIPVGVSQFQNAHQGSGSVRSGGGIKQVVKNTPPTPKPTAEDFNNKGDEFFNDKDYNNAIKNYKQAILLKPNYAEAHDSLADSYFILTNYDEAIKEYKQAIQYGKPDWADPYNGLGDALFNQKKFAEAIDPYEQTVRRNPKASSAYHNLGLIYFGMYENTKDVAALNKAVAAFKNSAQLDSRDWEANDYLGKAYDRLQQYDAAVTAYRKAISINNNLAEAHYSEGAALYNVGRYEEAIVAYKQGIDGGADATKAGFPNIYGNIGDAYLRLNKYDEAATNYKHAVILKQADANTYNNLGYVSNKLNRFSDAIESYRTAISFKPALEDAFLGEAYDNFGYALGKNAIVNHMPSSWPEAIEAFKKAISLKPDDVEAITNLGWAYNQTGRFTEGLAASKQALQLNPDYPAAQFNLGFASYKLNNYSDAVAGFKEAARLRPDWAKAFTNLGVAYGSLNQWKDAINAHKEAVRLNPKYAEAIYNLGVAYFMDGNKKEAMDQYNILQTLNTSLAQNLYYIINKRLPSQTGSNRTY